MSFRSQTHIPQRFAPFLTAGERVHALVRGTREIEHNASIVVHTGMLLATDERLIFAGSGPDQNEFGFYPHHTIDGLEADRDMLGFTVGFQHKGLDVLVKWIHDPHFRRFFKTAQALRNAQLDELSKRRDCILSPPRRAATQ